MISFLRAWSNTPFLEGEVAETSLATAKTLGEVIDDITESAVANINTSNLGSKYINRAYTIEIGLTDSDYSGPKLLRAIASAVSFGIVYADTSGFDPPSALLRETWKSNFSDDFDEDPEHLDDAVTEWLDNLDWVT